MRQDPGLNPQWDRGKLQIRHRPRLAQRPVETPLSRVARKISLLWHELTQTDPAQRAFREVVAGAAAASRLAVRRG